MATDKGVPSNKQPDAMSGSIALNLGCLLCLLVYCLLAHHTLIDDSVSGRDYYPYQPL